MTIKQSVKNTFDRVGIDYNALDNSRRDVATSNRFTGETVETTELIAHCIEWVYKINNQYEMGRMDINVSDFDRVRYFVLEQDHNAYMTCLD